MNEPTHFPPFPTKFPLMVALVAITCSPVDNPPPSQRFFDVVWTASSGQWTLHTAELEVFPSGLRRARDLEGEVLGGRLAGLHFGGGEAELQGRELRLGGGVEVSGLGLSLQGEELVWRVGSPRGELGGGVEVAGPGGEWEGENLAFDRGGIQLRGISRLPEGVEEGTDCVQLDWEADRPRWQVCGDRQGGENP